MGNELIIAILSLGGTALGTFGGILAANKLTNYRIQQLEIKVEKHNCLVDRTYKLEKNDEVFDEKFKVINHRIDDLEKE